MQESAIDHRPAARRRFLVGAASAWGLALTGCRAALPRTGGRAEESEGAVEVTPGEDLMQEHGVLERILLLYGEAARRIEDAEPLDPGVVNGGAGIVRRFIEDYHEMLEEEFVFPRLEGAGQELPLVAVLRLQHQRGRELTTEIARLSSGKATPELALALRRFERMYRPHAAREETVLFPAFRKIVGGAAYRELGEEFEEREHERLGEHGFEGAVAEVARLEEALDIADLSRFTA